ncbi:MAG: sulfate ABC transporter permease subunit [Lachnospiraceae bacterium]|nr:sulfate ABC transporter permease subunit [Lachnospiraceae bacterium]MDD7178282.1 sulfate ABC transporter permease subunit [bacterium]MDY5516783.1 sulfate ABC transporter permease subunit [Lachnospiraceae bacterium]
MRENKDHVTTKNLTEQNPAGRKNKIVKYILIGICVLFLFVMLVLPLCYIVSIAFGSGIRTYLTAITDKYTLKAMKLTITATLWALGVNMFFGLSAAWCLTRFDFRGKKVISTLIDLPLTISPVIAGLVFLLTYGRQSVLYPLLNELGISVIFAVPGVVLATIFVTFPYISREIIPVLNTIGTDEEEAAALMGMNGFTIFRKITFPHIRWAFLFGVVLCTARAMGEFGAVSVLSGHLRGLTNTLPLHVEVLYQGYDFTGAFAVSSLLVIMAVVILILRNILEKK